MWRFGDKCGHRHTESSPARLMDRRLKILIFIKIPGAWRNRQAESHFSEGALSGSRRPDDLDAEVADLLAQRVAVEPEKIGRPDLIAPRRGKRGGDQGELHLAQD